MLEVSAGEVKRGLDGGRAVHLLDVREAEELSICRIPGAEHIPMIELLAGLEGTKAPKEAGVVVFCHVGLRSLEAARFLRLRGWENARSMAGGIDAWAREVDPSLSRY